MFVCRLSRLREGSGSFAQYSGKCACLVRSTDRARHLNDHHELVCGFHKSIRIRDTARAIGYSHTVVVPTRMKVAWRCWKLVQMYLHSWRDYCLASPPYACFHLRKYDSATFTLRNRVDLPVLGALEQNQTTRPIHVMVQKRVLLLAWPSRMVELVYPCPSLPIANTTA